MPFKYLRDPLFVLCFAIYCGNWLLEQFQFSPEIAQYYLNDLICIPFWVPIIVWILHRLGLRETDGRPSVLEIAVPLIMISLVFEGLLPAMEMFRGKAVADPLDVHCYVMGAFVANRYWRAKYESNLLSDGAT